MEHNGSGISVGITTRNRPEILEYTLRQFDRYTPSEIRIIVIDDDSDDPEANRLVTEPYAEYFLNEKRLGVAKSKNECIKELDTEHVFLFDDDCFPTCDFWWDDWIVGENHMVYSPGKEHHKMKEKSKEMQGGLGCCLYFSRKCLDTIGGFDPEFGMWGYEHAEISNRIFMAGLSSYVYISPLKANVFSFDFSGSHHDKDGSFIWESKSSVTKAEKAKFAGENGVIFQKAVAKMKSGDLKRDIWNV